MTLLILLVLIITVIRLNINKKSHVKWVLTAKKNVEAKMSLKYLSDFWRTIGFRIVLYHLILLQLKEKHLQ